MLDMLLATEREGEPKMNRAIARTFETNWQGLKLILHQMHLDDWGGTTWDNRRDGTKPIVT